MIKIRELKEKDNFTDLIELSKSFFKEYERYHKDYFKLNQVKRRDIIKFFLDKNNKTIIALKDRKIVGYISFSIKKRPSFYKMRDVGYISGLMVDKSYRKRGIACSLLEEAKKYFLKRKVKYFYLETSVNNKLGIEFYKENKMKPLRIQYIGNLRG